MALDKIIEVTSRPSGESSLVLARVGAINEFHWVDASGTLYLRTDTNNASGSFYDKEGFAYSPLRKADLSPASKEMNKELIERALASMQEYRRQQSAQYQAALGVMATSTLCF